jgi:uncharacterized protein YejL (UPF0352 family)
MVPVAVGLGVMAANLIGNQLNSAAEQEQKQQGRAYIQGAQSSANSAYNRIINGIGDYYKQRGSLGNASDSAAYRQAIEGYNPDSFVYTPGQFNAADYGVGSREDYVNPYYNQIINDTAAQVQHTAAGAGVGRGSGAARAIATEVAQKNNDLWREANQEYKDERNFAYNQYSDYIQNMQNALNARRAATDTKLTMQGNLANDYYSVMDSAQSDKLKALQDQIATNSTYSTAMAGLY